MGFPMLAWRVYRQLGAARAQKRPSELTQLEYKALRVQVPNNHIFTQDLCNRYCPKPKYLIIGYLDPLERFGGATHRKEVQFRHLP